MTATTRRPCRSMRGGWCSRRRRRSRSTPSSRRRPGKGGRGAEVDISGASFQIVSDRSGGAPDGTILLSADELTNLNAASLLIGGTRTDYADGTTSLDVTANLIVVANDAAHPLEGPEIVLAVDGSGAGITLADGATIRSTGTITNAPHRRLRHRRRQRRHDRAGRGGARLRRAATPGDAREHRRRRR